MGLHDMLRQRPVISAEYFNESNGRVSIYIAAKNRRVNYFNPGRVISVAATSCSMHIQMDQLHTELKFQ